MKLRSRILGLTTIASSFALTSCTTSLFESPLYFAVTISPRPISIPVGGSMVFTGTISNDLGAPQWSVLDSADATGSVGTLTSVSGSSTSILYTAPSTPPIYTSAAGANFTQGWVTVDVTVAPPAQTTLPAANDQVAFFIAAPSITVGISPATVAVALGGTQLFAGYAVGNINNAVTWQVDGVTGGSVANGTITPAGYYSAPASLPMTGATVTITVISQADATKSASAVVTLQ
jgi:hypothetical protein